MQVMKELKDRTVAYDCRYFLGDRPCVWHKESGALCRCENYRKVGREVLIIKLDAMGDVLRTTCILPGLRERHPDARITWLTRDEAAPLLEQNPFVDAIVTYGTDALVELLSRRYDEIVNLDAGRVSAGLAALADGAVRTGFVMSPEQHVEATNPAAEEWLKLGVFDDLKKSNRRTYQQVVSSILDLPPDRSRYILELTREERAAARDHLIRIGLRPGIPVLGVHTGGGGRWTRKQWTEANFTELIRQLKVKLGDRLQILLFGGPLERQRNARMAASLGGRVFDSGCENSARHFAALVSQCAVILTGDSLALHVALATGRRTVALFGPTSHAEIEMFGLGEKVYPEMDCLVCYLSDCTVVPTCMENISVETVKAAVLRQLEKAGEQNPVPGA